MTDGTKALERAREAATQAKVSLETAVACGIDCKVALSFARDLCDSLRENHPPKAPGDIFADDEGA